MTATHVRGSIKGFWRTSWRFQRTFEAPLPNLDPFVDAIISTLTPIQTASVIVEGYVFDPKTLRALLSANSLNIACAQDDCIVADTTAEATALLRATLADWLDFAFIPSPRPYVIYADHDECVTFFANTKSNLNQAANVLVDRGFKELVNYQRSR